MIHAEDKIRFSVRCPFSVLALGLAGGEFVSAQGMFGPEIARADSIRTAAVKYGLYDPV